MFMFQERKRELKSGCFGFKCFLCEDFSTKQKAMFVFLSALLIGAVAGACVYVANKGKLKISQIGKHSESKSRFFLLHETLSIQKP